VAGCWHGAHYPAGKWAAPDESGATYVEHLTTADLSVGTYSLRAGADDRQSPHTEDEIYVVRSGRAKFTSGAKTIDANEGDVLFVPSGEAHRFHDIVEDLALLVFFGPAEGSRAASGNGD
jgi:mannose-6-phosphate isomerase-like protein (cupin superfamily)